MSFADKTMLDLDSEKLVRLQVEETLSSIREESVAKDQEVEELKVNL